MQPNRFSQEVERARARGQSVLDLSLSNPTQAGITYDERSIRAALSGPEVLQYDPQPKGAPAARRAVAEYYRERGENIDIANLVLTGSTSEGYSHVFRLLANAGEEILIPKPSYPLFDFLADLQDVKLVSYPLIYDHGWQIDFHSLEQAIGAATRGIVLVHPNNPTGSYVSAEERRRLNELSTKNGLALIVDEVFLDYAVDGLRHASFATNAGALTFTLSGVSKISALPQMKLGWVAVSGPEASAALERLEVIADTYLSVSAPVQAAAKVLLDQRGGVQRELLDRIRENLAELERQLSMQKVCAGLAVEGGWYGIVRVPVTQSDEELAIRLLRECAVLVHPGHFYDFAQDGYLVVSLIVPQQQFKEAIGRVLRLIAEG